MGSDITKCLACLNQFLDLTDERPALLEKMSSDDLSELQALGYKLIELRIISSARKRLAD